jgi:hypothetical protein
MRASEAGELLRLLTSVHVTEEVRERDECRRTLGSINGHLLAFQENGWESEINVGFVFIFAPHGATVPRMATADRAIARAS